VPKPHQTGRIYAYRVIHRIQLTGVVALVVLAGLMVGACGGSSSSPSQAVKASPSPSPSPIKYSSADACTLVSLTDAIAVTGNPAVANQAGAQVPGLCVYAASDGSGTSVIVFAQLYPDATSANAISADQIAASINSSSTGLANAKAVNGIGDTAFEYNFTASGSGTGLMIFVKKANVVFLIALAPVPTDATQLAAVQKKLEDLATKAANSLH
jgi:hypothetical protein